MHRLIINKLGPITHTEIECNKFMVIIGSQASGKSTIAKALYFFKTIKDDIINLLLKRHNLPSNSDQRPFILELETYMQAKFMGIFGSSSGMDDAMCVHYDYAHDISITVCINRATNSKRIVCQLSPALLEHLDASDDTVRSSSAVTNNVQQVLRRDLSLLFDDEYETVMIPAGRSVLTLLATQINYLYSIMDDDQKRSIDLCTRQYIENIIKLRPLYQNGYTGMFDLYPNTTLQFRHELGIAQKIAKEILKGSYHYVNGDERLDISDNQYVKINFASSGQQEAVWIINLLFYYLLQPNRSFFIIEEPESHLFPEAQKLMIDLISLVVNCGHCVFITTHSPYVLGALNNLIYAGQASDNVKNAVNNIVDTALWVHRGSISAWCLDNGTAQPCINVESDLIQNELIDGISNVINDQFDQILAICSQQQNEPTNAD